MKVLRYGRSSKVTNPHFCSPIHINVQARLLLPVMYARDNRIALLRCLIVLANRKSLLPSRPRQKNAHSHREYSTRATRALDASSRLDRHEPLSLCARHAVTPPFSSAERVHGWRGPSNAHTSRTGPTHLRDLGRGLGAAWLRLCGTPIVASSARTQRTAHGCVRASVHSH